MLRYEPGAAARTLTIVLCAPLQVSYHLINYYKRNFAYKLGTRDHNDINFSMEGNNVQRRTYKKRLFDNR